MQVAMEISANEFIREPLPGKPPVWQDYTTFGVHSGQSTLERYECLVQARREGRIPPRIVYVLVDDHLPMRECANEPCDVLFVRQRGRAKHGQHRAIGIKYCSTQCAAAQSQRDRRRRERVKAVQKHQPS